MANEQINGSVERETELRHLKPNQLHQIAKFLDHNNDWEKLLEIIPKKLNAKSSSYKLDWDEKAERRFTNDDIRQIKKAVSHYDDGLCGYVLLDEWSTMGKKEERPTVGVLLQLLVKKELFRAADYVAEKILNEPLPERPTEGPAAPIDIFGVPTELIEGVQSFVEDSSYNPGTTTLLNGAGYTSEYVPMNNQDFMVKHVNLEKRDILREDENTAANNPPPQPPPRSQRRNQYTQNICTTSAAISLQRQEKTQSSMPTHITEQEIPKFSDLLNVRSEVTSNQRTSDAMTGQTLVTYLDNSPRNSSQGLPNLSLFQESSMISENVLQSNAKNGEAAIDLPLISALNLNGSRSTEQILDQHESSQYNGLADVAVDGLLEEVTVNRNNSTNSQHHHYSRETYNDDITNKADGHDDEDDDNDDNNRLPDLSIFDNCSSNNDSSLTNVTGTGTSASTSGDNSFDLSSSTSNENLSNA